MGLFSFVDDIFGGGGGGAAAPVTTTTSTSTSWSQTIQQDQRVTAEDAELVAGAAAVVSMPGSVAVSPGSRVGDIVIQEFTPEVQKTVGDIIDAFSEMSQQATEVYARSSQDVTEVLGEKLLTTQQGVASIVPEMAKYLAIAVVVIIIARKVIK